VAPRWASIVAALLQLVVPAMLSIKRIGTLFSTFLAVAE
jgi:hypothetical protein